MKKQLVAPRRYPLLPMLALALAMVQGVVETLALLRARLARPRLKN